MTPDFALKALELVAGSWPIAFITVGIGIAFVVRRCFKQALDNDKAEKEARNSGERAVVVQPARHIDD